MVIEITEWSDYPRVTYSVGLASKENRKAFENEYGTAPHSTKQGMFKMMCDMVNFVNNELKDECFFTIC